MEEFNSEKNRQKGLIDPNNRDEIINAENLIKDIDKEISDSLDLLENQTLSPEQAEKTKIFVEQLKGLRKEFEDGIKKLQEAEEKMKKLLTTTRPEQLM